MKIFSYYSLYIQLGLILPAELAAEETKPVSYFHDIRPIWKRSCIGCHHPGKLKGELDLTTYAAFKKGGKHGAPFKPGEPGQSRIIEMISGSAPDMPKEGDPLSAAEVALVERWIKAGSQDDSPALSALRFTQDKPPVYLRPPVISALAFSPDGQTLAVSGYHEILLHKADGSGLNARLVGESPRIEGICFSKDGRWLAACGGAPALFGEVQIWSVTNHSLMQAYKIGLDSLYGISISDDGRRVAFGGADKIVRMISVEDGKELMKFDNHGDWVFATLFTLKGQRLLSGSRDRAMKLIDVANGQFIDDINKLLEGVLCMARHPKENQVVYGGDMGMARIYKIAENQGRTAANNDVNLVREFERQPGPIHAIAYSPDGAQIAIGSMGDEVRVYKTSDGSRAATFMGHPGAVFALAYHPQGKRIATGGYDGQVRLFDTASGELIKGFSPVPFSEAPRQKASR